MNILKKSLVGGESRVVNNLIAFCTLVVKTLLQGLKEVLVILKRTKNRKTVPKQSQNRPIKLAFGGRGQTPFIGNW